MVVAVVVAAVVVVVVVVAVVVVVVVAVVVAVVVVEVVVVVVVVVLVCQSVRFSFALSVRRCTPHGAPTACRQANEIKKPIRAHAHAHAHAHFFVVPYRSSTCLTKKLPLGLATRLALARVSASTPPPGRNHASSMTSRKPPASS